MRTLFILLLMLVAGCATTPKSPETIPLVQAPWSVEQISWKGTDYIKTAKLTKPGYRRDMDAGERARLTLLIKAYGERVGSNMFAVRYSGVAVNSESQDEFYSKATQNWFALSMRISSEERAVEEAEQEQAEMLAKQQRRDALVADLGGVGATMNHIEDIRAESAEPLKIVTGYCGPLGRKTILDGSLGTFGKTGSIQDLYRGTTLSCTNYSGNFVYNAQNTYVFTAGELFKLVKILDNGLITEYHFKKAPEYTVKIYDTQHNYITYVINTSTRVFRVVDAKLPISLSSNRTIQGGDLSLTDNELVRAIQTVFTDNIKVSATDYAVDLLMSAEAREGLIRAVAKMKHVPR